MMKNNNPLFKHNDYRRLIQLRQAEEIKDEDSEYYILEGKAAPFDEATVLFEFGGVQYSEIIDRHAFDEADMSNVFLKYNHETSVFACARTKNGTLELEIREDGLYMKAKLLKSLSTSKELYEAVRSGLIDKMSFAFTIREQSFDNETKTWTLRKIDKVYDVAPVDIPAYDNTNIYARRLSDVEARLKEVEASRLELARVKALAKIKI